MLRAHSFKDAEAKNSDINMGVFNYPILMAADILGYGIDLVPVGQDQRQHLEMARDIARAFNRTYGTEILIEPEEFILPEVATIPGLDGRKMSKSYNNFIGVFEEEKTLKKKISTIVTDSRGVDESKDPDTCNIFGLIQYFGSPERVNFVRAKYLEGGYGYGHAKAELLEILIDYLAPYQQLRAELLGDISFVEARLAQGASIMNARLEITLEQVRQITGV
jgi:tryptophanyl-tRNA synthetase